MTQAPVNPIIKARELRRQQTKHEIFLWKRLRAKRFQGYKFRRQQPFGPYILDFFCASAKVAIELDGGQHQDHENQEHDRKRTNFLNNNGICVLRFWNNQIYQDTNAVLNQIFKQLNNPSPDFDQSKSPSPSRGEGLE